MSRGPGKWDQLIAAQLRERIGFPLNDLHAWLVPPRGAWTPAEYQALYRAARKAEGRGDCELRVERLKLEADPLRPSNEDGQLHDTLLVYRPGFAPAVLSVERPQGVREVDRVALDEADMALVAAITSNPTAWTRTRGSSPEADGHFHRAAPDELDWVDSSYDESQADPDYEEDDLSDED